MTDYLKWIAALSLFCGVSAAQVRMDAKPDRISITIDGQPYSTFFIGPETTRPYLHPLRSASGKIVTRRYPMEEVVGEARDHPHHRGLWLGHGEVNGFDFWLDERTPTSPPRGRIVLAGAPSVKSGQKTGSLQATFNWLDPQGKPIIKEARTMVFHADPTLRIVDVDETLTALEKTTFGDTKEGTFAIRVTTALEEPCAPEAKGSRCSEKLPGGLKRTGKIVNAEGLEDEKNAWGKRSPWVDYFGELEGERLGVAILDHPSNPKHPTYWHARGYGLFSANIFAEHDYYRDKSRNGSVTLNQGESLRFRYRVVIHPGDHRTANIAKIYKAYALLK